jgi:large subunit ribosomal protein L29
MPRRIEKIREAGVNELEAQHKELTEQIFRLRFQLTTGQAEALKRLREARKDLARVKTLLRVNELQSATKAAQTKSRPAAARKA